MQASVRRVPGVQERDMPQDEAWQEVQEGHVPSAPRRDELFWRKLLPERGLYLPQRDTILWQLRQHQGESSALWLLWRCLRAVQGLLQWRVCEPEWDSGVLPWPRRSLHA